MGQRKELIYGIVKKFGQYYQRLRVDRERSRYVSPDSESGSEDNLPDARPLPIDCQVVYSEHSHSHTTPTLMHLVEFTGQADSKDASRLQITVLQDVYVICNCNPSMNPDEETVVLYGSQDIPLLDDN